jgi:hypothetical protein
MPAGQVMASVTKSHSAVKGTASRKQNDDGGDEKQAAHDRPRDDVYPTITKNPPVFTGGFSLSHLPFVRCVRFDVSTLA